MFLAANFPSLQPIFYLSLLRPAILYVCNLEENLLFSTLILGLVFNDYVVFYGDSYKAVALGHRIFSSELLSNQVKSR